MTDLRATRPEKAADAVAHHIEGLILEGSLRPGEALLAERELAQRLNVSRPTLRDALKLLEARGLLISEARGTRVARLGAEAITDPLVNLLTQGREVADHYLEFRDVVESSAAALAAERATAPDRARFTALMARIEAAHEAGDPAEEAEVDAELHLAIYEASHNLVLLQIMQALATGLRQDVSANRHRLFVMPHTREKLRDQHLAIGRAILAGDAEGARRATHEHLAWIRQAAREIRESEAKHSLAVRRQDGGGLSAERRPG